ncbi:MAG: PPC domain-containing protein [Methanothrix sp.]
MRMANLICLMAILLISQPAVAQEASDASCMAKDAADLGSIKMDGLNIEQSGILAPGELKWFKLTATEPAKLFMKVSEADEEDYYSSTDFGLVVFDENMNYVASSSEVLLLDLLTGVYYIRLDARPYEEVNYTLIANNNIETEPNDGMNEANDLGTISGSLVIGGSLEPSADADFFKFDVEAGKSGMLEIDSDTDGYNDLSMALYSFNESKQRYLPEFTGGSSLNAFITSGTFYLRVLDRYSDTYNYSINITLTSMTCDEEPNDSFEEAISLGTLNSTSALIAEGCIQPSLDEDYYEFEVPNNSDIKTVTIKTITKGDTRLYLYDEDEDQITYNDDYKGVGPSRITEDLEPGIYYLMVNAYSSSGIVGYKISVAEGEEDDDKSIGEW